MEYWKVLRSKVGKERIIIPGVDVAVTSSKGILLVRNKDNGNWFLPGGLQELGESIFETGTREVLEELGIEITAISLISVYSGSKWVRKYSNGDELQSLTFLLSCEVRESELGSITIDESELIEYGWFKPNELPKNMQDYAASMVKDVAEFSGKTIIR